jgi:hypothetical protein
MTSAPQPGWYADPARAADLRWWDGGRWTDAVVLGGVQRVSPLGAPRREQVVERSLLAEPVLVVDRDGDVRGVRAPDGRRLGSVVGRVRSGLLDRLRSTRLQVRDAAGEPQLLLTRAPSLGRAPLVVERPGGGEVGQLVQEAGRYALVSAGRPVGALQVHGSDVVVLDASGAEVARSTETVGERVVRVHGRLPDPLGPLAVAAALAVAG